MKSIGLFIFIVPIYGCFSANQLLSLNQIIEQVNTGQAILLDVRTREEYEKVKAKGALHFPLHYLQNGQMPNIESKKQIYTYCQSRMRSEKARKILIDNGYTAVKHIGSIGIWQEEGGQVESTKLPRK
ncbi:hypothetical protein CMK14_22035 [Candidatus Poribacteria bacterium]|nr:hypothetical protein [Candidatus Poribacteria bacterium]